VQVCVHMQVPQLNLLDNKIRLGISQIGESFINLSVNFS